MSLLYSFAICLYFICLNYLPSFIVFDSAIIGFLNSTVLMRLCQLNGEIVYIYNLTV